MKLKNIVYINKDYKWVIGDITTENNIITELVEKDWAYERGIIPPFSDIHIHGGYGVDVMDCDHKSLCYLAERLLENNVGMWMPTTVADDFDTIINCAKAVKKANENNGGAEIAGIHIEGPFISKKYKGIMEGKYISSCDTRLFDDIKNVVGDMAIRFTIAPEVDGAEEFCDYVTQNGGFVSMGHSGASALQCRRLLQKGANSYTHLFNAMSSLHHREENILVHALNGSGYCEIIADEIHILPEILCLALNVVGDRAVLVTDALKPMGMGEGNFVFCGEEITVKNKKATNSRGRLAGSVLTMKNAVCNAEKYIGYEKALKIGCENPSRVINMFDKIGSIDIGKRLYL